MSPEQSIWSPSATRIRTAAKSASPIIGATLVGLATPIVQGDPCVLHRAFGRVRIPVEGSPIAILQAEVNSSPGTDLIVLSRLQTNSPSDLGARPLLNEGNGRFSFTARNLGRCGSAPAAFTKADFNNDGWIDLASTCPEDGSVWVLRGFGDGEFVSFPVEAVAIGGMPAEIAAGDLDGDGLTDLAVFDASDNSLALILQNLDGHFTESVRLPLGAEVVEIEVADLDNDQNDDILLLMGQSGQVLVLNNLGSLQFDADVFDVGANPSGMHIADIDLDGTPDVVTANYGEDDISVLLNQGNGSFSPQIRTACGTGPTTLASSDFNGDGFPDLCVSLSTPSIGVLLGNADGSFGLRHAIELNDPANGVAALDVDQDGSVDIAALNPTGHVEVLFGFGSGDFAPDSTSLIDTNPRPEDLVLTHLDGDDYPDLLVVNSSNPARLSSFTGTRAGEFLPRSTSAVNGKPPALAVGDLNDDGYVDAVTIETAILNGSFTEAASVYLADGDSGFHPQVRYPTSIDCNDIAIADLNGDSLLDVITLNGPQDGFSVLLGDGSGSLGPASNVAHAGSLGANFVVTDLNNDGLLDLAFAEYNGFGTRLGNGDGTFTTYSFRDVISGPKRIAVGDVDRDGFVDLAVAHSIAVNIYRGLGDGTFSEPEVYPLAEGAWTLDIADLTGDASPEIVVGHYFGGEGLSILENNGLGDFAAPLYFTAGGGTMTALAIGDVNDDEKADVLATDRQNDRVVVMTQMCGENPCASWDSARPFGVLDLADISAFITGFAEADPAADLAVPFGTWDLADLVRFVTGFSDGCP